MIFDHIVMHSNIRSQVCWFPWLDISGLAVLTFSISFLLFTWSSGAIRGRLHLCRGRLHLCIMSLWVDIVGLHYALAVMEFGESTSALDAVKDTRLGHARVHC